VAKAAVETGAEIVNDVSGGKWDDEMLSTVARMRCGYVLTHTRGRPQEWKSQAKARDLVGLVDRELRKSAERAVAQRVERTRIVLDPGFGFGKRFEENYKLLAHFEDFARTGFPLLAGPSRKGFLGRTLARDNSEGQLEDAPPQERLYGTLASVTACILSGAHIVRVHDVRAARDAALVADEILKAQ
jgi:dihydropteroate synthase